MRLFLVLSLPVILAMDISSVPQELIDIGRKKYQALQEATKLPEYGDCWIKSVEALQDGCRVLSDSIQSDLALRFTNCFLEMSGQEHLDCLNERTPALKRLCLKEMPDRAYTAYTEFYGQAPSLCYFLQSQLWHRETEKTIDRLTSSSRTVSEQLVASTELQSQLIRQQFENLEAQKALAESLNVSRTTLEEMTLNVQLTTLEQRSILLDLFKEFHILHNWLVGRYSLVDRLLYYGVFLGLIMILTSVQFAANARIFLLLNLMLNFFLEWMLPSFLAVLVPDTRAIDNVAFDNCVWALRKIFIFTAIAILAYFVYYFENTQSKQLALLREIQSQNKKIMQDMMLFKLANGSSNHFRERSKTPEPERVQIDSFMVPEKQFVKLSTLVEEQEQEDDVDRAPGAAEFMAEPARSLSRASTVSQTSSRYNLRRRTEVFARQGNFDVHSA